MPLALHLRFQICAYPSLQPISKNTSLRVRTHVALMLCRDTVDSVGIVPRRLPFTTSNTIVRTFRQALALDERRVNFGANGWNNPSDREAQLGVHQTDGHEHVRAHDHLVLRLQETTGSVIDMEYDGTDELADLEVRYATKRPIETDVYEVWFAGCHSGELSRSNDFLAPD